MHMSCAGSWATRRQPMHLAAHALALALAQSGWIMSDALALRRGLSSVGSADGALHHPIRMLRMRVPFVLARPHLQRLHLPPSLLLVRTFAAALTISTRQIRFV